MWKALLCAAVLVLVGVVLDYGVPAFYNAGYCGEQVRLGGRPCTVLPKKIPYWP